MSMTSRLIAVFLAAFILLVGNSQPAVAQDAEPDLIVGINPIEPFVILDGESPQGFSVDLWNAVAAEAGVSYAFRELENVGALIDSAESGAIDIGIGATSITAEREATVDFSHPFFASGLQILTGPEADPGVFGTLRSIFTRNVLTIIAGSFGILLIIAHIAWWVERDENPAFQGSYLNGIWTAFYWTVTTATTVGYGDTVLRDNRGRLLALSWMLLSLFLVSYFTATITTRLTVARLDVGVNEPDDLRRLRVLTLPETTSARYLRDRGIRFRAVDTVELAAAQLVNGTADALVYDAPTLQYFVTRTEAQGLRLVPTVFREENYGMVMPQGSELRDPINQALLRVYESGTYDLLRQRWFGATE